MLSGHVAIVTGGGQGIGKAIALRLADDGADVAILDVNEATATETADEIIRRGRRADVRTIDISDQPTVAATMDAVVSALGRVDILVNNAGVEKMTPLLEVAPADWDRQVAVNLSGTFYCLQAAARHMASLRYGRIVNISRPRSSSPGPRIQTVRLRGLCTPRPRARHGPQFRVRPDV